VDYNEFLPHSIYMNYQTSSELAAQWRNG